MADDEAPEKTPEGKDSPGEKAPDEAPVEGGDTEGSAAPPPPRSGQDPLNTEFLYYSSVLRVVGPTLTHESDRKLIMPWVRKLFRPEYHSSKLREKRNRYLAYLSTSLLLDEAIGVFRQYPPDAALPDLSTLPKEPVEAAEWEMDKTWQETLAGLPEDFQMLECCVHASEDECSSDHKLDKILDQEFQLLLYIAKPYAFMILNGNDRTRVAAWFQMLCSIHGGSSCSSMKAIRNDYLMALLGI
ncbi:unnamed protein product [Acanthoscelides obtectus]|uniref:DUF4485 domain-containing protein n=1 Tax=Acanthoscelides obtectus TaxID=200917 RepID=A0A9P0LGI5_ACAOB|nr:unnamed protein product [Acanthoscelides obtectus]CAK1621827.1 hypothetical protein AOBTE_LOCUS1154 [Acanthoscelides obtectus]